MPCNCSKPHRWCPRTGCALPLALQSPTPIECPAHSENPLPQCGLDVQKRASRSLSWRHALGSSMKSLWAMVQGDPVFMRRVNGWLAVFWIVMIPVSLMMGWLNSVVYVSALSLWALVSGHWSAWQAARVEVQQQKEAADARRQDVAGEVVERLAPLVDHVQPSGAPASATSSPSS